ncbi:hypothetical protein [Sulfurimonas sp.]|uniref:hypothetical protein n=1 Tax=Sulfurimonas sp. TaxID=2022749 RepID=UPI0025CD05FF|nr:hypothetical protein [Sulfurimonas sp.]MDD5157963.1 hypothetical protein [Sulfurimonas sp.]
MKKLFLYLVVLFLFFACSFDTPPNEWQFKSINAFDSYQKNFLSSNDTLAKNDLSRAIKHAKSSDDLTTLARIYLGECALNISVGISDKCENYEKISSLIKDETLNSYFLFINKQSSDDSLKLLPKQYKNFSRYLKEQDYKKANETLREIKEATSMFLCTAILEDSADDESIDKVISTASLYGYKKVVIYWLNIKKNRTFDSIQKEKIARKISILGS